MKTLSEHQQRSLNRIQSKVGYADFTMPDIYGLAIRRLEFTLENLLKKGVLTRKMNPDKKHQGSYDDRFWVYKIVN